MVLLNSPCHSEQCLSRAGLAQFFGPQVSPSPATSLPSYLTLSLFLAATRPSAASTSWNTSIAARFALLLWYFTSSLTLNKHLFCFFLILNVFLHEQASADALFCSQSCRSKDASNASQRRPRFNDMHHPLPASASTSTSPAAPAASNRPQLTIAMPLSFAPSSRLGPHSATTPLPSVPLPTREQLAARSRRYTAPSSSRHPLLLQPSANTASPEFPSSPARPHPAPVGVRTGTPALASPFPSHPIVLPQGYKKSPRTSQQHKAAVEAANEYDEDIDTLLGNQAIVSTAASNGKRYVSSAPNVSIITTFHSWTLSIFFIMS